MTPGGACSTAADCTTTRATARRATAMLDEARAAAAPGNERATIVAHLAGVQPSPQRRRRALPRGAVGSRRRRCAPGDDPPRSRRADALHGGNRARRGARGARRQRRLTGRRRRPPVSRARGVRPHALQRRPRHTDRGDGGGARARTIAGRVAARRRSDVGLRVAALVVGGRRPRAGRSSRRS